MKSIFTLILIICLSLHLQAQDQPIDRSFLTFGNGDFFQNGQQVKMAEVIRITAINDEAQALAKKARRKRNLALVTGYPGYFAIGWGLGGLLSGAPVEWEWVGIGTGLVVGSFFLDAAFDRNARLATEVFNATTPFSSQKIPLVLAFGVQRNGLGFSLNF